jgi:hypothetical protein
MAIRTDAQLTTDITNVSTLSDADALIQKSDLQALMTNFNDSKANKSELAGLGGAVNSIKVYNVKDYGVSGNNDQDDAPGIQAAIDACFDAGGGIVYFPNGIYRMDTMQGADAHLQIPLSPYNSAPNYRSIHLLGESIPNKYSNPQAINKPTDNNPPTTGVIFRSTLYTGGLGNFCFIEAEAGTSPWTVKSWTYLYLENIRFRIYSKTGSTNVQPIMGGVDGTLLAYMDIRNCFVDTDSERHLSMEPAGSSFGFRLPQTGNWVSQRVENTSITGVADGITFGEHGNAAALFLDGCVHGIKFRSSNHGIHIDRVCIARCKYNLWFAGNCVVTIDQMDLEDDPENFSGSWSGLIHDIRQDTPTAANAEAYIRYNRVKSGIGVEQIPLTNTNTGPSNIFTLAASESVPAWTTATRPGIRRPGMTGFNRTTTKLETWDGTAWQNHW